MGAFRIPGTMACLRSCSLLWGIASCQRRRKLAPTCSCENGAACSSFCTAIRSYRVDALFREYRRDVIRFLSGEQESYPDLPEGYFDEDTAGLLATFRERAIQQRSIDLIADLPVHGAANERRPHAWRNVAVKIFANWLSYLVVEGRGLSRGTTLLPKRCDVVAT